MSWERFLSRRNAFERLAVCLEKRGESLGENKRDGQRTRRKTESPVITLLLNRFISLKRVNRKVDRRNRISRLPVRILVAMDETSVR